MTLRAVTQNLFAIERATAVPVATAHSRWWPWPPSVIPPSADIPRVHALDRLPSAVQHPDLAIDVEGAVGERDDDAHRPDAPSPAGKLARQAGPLQASQACVADAGPWAGPFVPFRMSV